MGDNEKEVLTSDAVYPLLSIEQIIEDYDIVVEDHPDQLVFSFNNIGRAAYNKRTTEFDGDLLNLVYFKEEKESE